jgi:SAM-dependent methyltransferase
MATDFFGERVARAYDADAAEVFESSILDPTVDFLAELARGGPVLELGIGTGRVALPLRERGLAVHGIDLSEAMVRRLREKPGGADVVVTIGDFASERVGDGFQLVYLVFNTIMNLTTQEEQVRCFRNAADHLVDGGHFVIEVLVPELQRLPLGESILPCGFDDTHVGFDEIDVATQSLTSHHHYFRGDHTETFSIPFRYVWPAELDLMARIADLSLVERWGDWDRSPFDRTSRKHISVWRTGRSWTRS